MSDPLAIRKNGIVHVLRPGELPIAVERHGSGGVVLKVGREGALLPPAKAIQVATALLEGVGIKLEKVAPDA